MFTKDTKLPETAPQLKVVWIGIEEQTPILFKMMNLDSSIFYFGFWEVNYEHLGCFLPVKALFWARESSKMCVFWPRKVGNVTVQICNISRMAWRNAMIFWGVEIGIISLISGGFYLKQDGSFGWKAKKLCFWGFFNFQPKRPSSIKNGLRTLFFIIRTNYGSNAVKNGLVVLSQCCLEVCVWHRNWKVQNLDKYVAFPIVFGTLTNTLATY